MTSPVLLLSPSRGLGGGIERYVATVESAFADHCISYQRLDLTRSGPAGHRALLAKAATELTVAAKPARLVLGHRALLPVAALLARTRLVSGISVICHGSDVWGDRRGPRWLLESRLMRRRDVRVIAASSFTAGSLIPGCRAAVLPPGLSRAWFGELASAAAAGPARRPGSVELMTAFRLGGWRDKGLAELTAAIAALRRTDVRLTVCGSGIAPPDLLAHVSAYPWCTVRPGLADRELAAQYAGAD
ncbi:MAG TPA: hypothetical protein VI365_06095, partial [Trebonia sp.]